MTGPIVHLVTGSTGAGKTTYSEALAKRVRAVRFSIDDWMMSLFGPDLVQPLEEAWMWERVARCEARILETARQIAASGSSVVLDLAFTTVHQRSATAAHFTRAGQAIALHWLDVDPTERWRRVSNRNLQKGQTFAFTVTQPMFDHFEALYQPPGHDEMRELNGIRVPS